MSELFKEQISRKDYMLMKESMNIFIPNDQMWLEDGEAWFVDVFENMLFNWNLVTAQCRYVAKIPGKAIYIRNNLEKECRVNPRCIKSDNLVFCLPTYGKSIIIYDIINDEFEEIEIENPNSEFPFMYNFWIYEGKIWGVVNGLNQIVEIDIEKKIVKEYYNIFESSQEKMGLEAIMVGEFIYGVSKTTNIVYEFNVITKKIEYYSILGMDEGITTICYDEGMFWVSGYKNRICIWDKKRNEIRHIQEFPEGFENGDCFSVSVCLGKYIWFLPSCLQEVTCNKILYIDKENYVTSTFDFGNAERTNLWEEKYVLEYIRESRYIGIRYSGNEYITEIDTNNFCTSRKYMKLDIGNITAYWNNRVKKLCNERNSNDIIFFIKANDNIAKNSKKSYVGKQIMDFMKNI